MSPVFEPRDLPGDLASVREAHAPGATVVNTPDFETLPPARAEELGLLADALDPASYPESWLPADAPAALRRYASDEFTVGMPGDGGVAWTAQTDPPTVFVKARLEGAPGDFVDFLIAEALVQAGLGLPEQFLPFFDGRYPDLAAATPLGPTETYQLAAALYEAYLGLHTRPVFAGWADEPDLDRLHAAWVDAGERLRPRLEGLAREVATGRTEFAAAAELACSAVKHDVTVPTPFGALDAEVYREYGAEYAVEWAERTFAELAADAEAGDSNDDADSAVDRDPESGRDADGPD